MQAGAVAWVRVRLRVTERRRYLRHARLGRDRAFGAEQTQDVAAQHLARRQGTQAERVNLRDLDRRMQPGAVGAEQDLRGARAPDRLLQQVEARTPDVSA